MSEEKPTEADILADHLRSLAPGAEPFRFAREFAALQGAREMNEEKPRVRVAKPGEFYRTPADILDDVQVQMSDGPLLSRVGHEGRNAVNHAEAKGL